MKIDKAISALAKRIDNLLGGSSPTHRWDNNDGISGPIIDNWAIINNAIRENEGNEWFVPSDDKINAWTSPAISGLGNIELRDFELEAKFQEMRCTRVEEYDRKWEEALARNDKEYLQRHPSNATAPTYWINWTKEELDYYENEERFPILKDKNYTPNWRAFSSEKA
jgi:hypothetical protein